jgi:uncharacterized surface protein with fasciclin (FAS1) repeats
VRQDLTYSTPTQRIKKERIMKMLIRTALCASILFSTASMAAMMSDNVMVGGAAMYPSKNIVENAINSKDHTTLVAAVKAAGLVETLEGTGPFTVFAPTNAAFSKLPAGTVENLVKPENKAVLTSILTYHVVAGTYDMKALEKKIKAGGGSAELTTVNGQPLWIMNNGPHNIQLKDGKGNIANISTYDVQQKNGVIDVIDTVLMPK